MSKYVSDKSRKTKLKSRFHCQTNLIVDLKTKATFFAHNGLSLAKWQQFSTNNQRSYKCKYTKTFHTKYITCHFAKLPVVCRKNRQRFCIQILYEKSHFLFLFSISVFACQTVSVYCEFQTVKNRILILEIAFSNLLLNQSINFALYSTETDKIFLTENENYLSNKSRPERSEVCYSK